MRGTRDGTLCKWSCCVLRVEPHVAGWRGRVFVGSSGVSQRPPPCTLPVYWLHTLSLTNLQTLLFSAPCNVFCQIILWDVLSSPSWGNSLPGWPSPSTLHVLTWLKGSKTLLAMLHSGRSDWPTAALSFSVVVMACCLPSEFSRRRNPHVSMCTYAPTPEGPCHICSRTPLLHFALMTVSGELTSLSSSTSAQLVSDRPVSLLGSLSVSLGPYPFISER